MTTVMVMVADGVVMTLMFPIVLISCYAGDMNPSFWGDALEGTLLNPTSGSLKGDLTERVYIPKGPP